MRNLILGAALIAVAIVGFHTLITNSHAVARDAKPATFLRTVCVGAVARDLAG
jgi:hypothetical protein